MKRRFEYLTNFFKKKEGRGFILFIVTFGIIKGNTFFSPLLLANIISVNDYGTLEYALSVGMILSGFFHLGIGSSYSFFNLRKKTAEYNSVVFLHGMIISFLGFIVGLLICSIVVDVIELRYTLSTQIILVYASQLILSSIHKTENKPNIAVLLDGGLYIPILIAALYILIINDASINSLSFLFFIYQVIILLLFIIKWKNTDKKLTTYRFKSIYIFGVNVFISGVFVIILTLGGRLIIEGFFNTTSVGYYSFYYRLASVVVLVHQAANIFFFKKIYTLEISKLDGYFSFFTIMLVISNIFLWFIIPVLFKEYIPVINKSIEYYNGLYLLLSLQMPFWINIALNENIIYREDLSKQFSVVLGLIILFAIGVLFVLKNIIDIVLSTVVFVNIVACYLVIEGQFYLIKQKTGVSFSKNRYVLLFIMAMATGVLCFIS